LARAVDEQVLHLGCLRIPTLVSMWNLPAMASMLFVVADSTSSLRGSSFECPKFSTVSITAAWPPRKGTALYQLEVSNSSDGRPYISQTSTETHAIVIDLQPGTEYTFAVKTKRALWPYADGAWQAWVVHGSSFKCQTADLKSSQTLVLPPKSTGSTELSVRLQAPAASEGLMHYEVYWKPLKSEGSDWRGPVNTTLDSVTIAGLDSAAEYEVAAVAVYASARGSPSDPVVYRTSSDARSSFYSFRLSTEVDGYLTNMNSASNVPYTLKYWFRDFQNMSHTGNWHGIKGATGHERLARYCVQSSALPWADYLTCNHQACTCQTKWDRCLNRLSLESCPEEMYMTTCGCSRSYAEEVVGQAPYYWPQSGMGPNGTCALPSAVDAEPTGFLYSFPGHAECTVPRLPTRSCSWSSNSVVHSISYPHLSQELLQQMSQASDVSEDDFARLATSSWAEAIQETFGRHERCCGC